ncbi:MAG: hypothetical protein WAQ27_04435 [Candidatus Microsaccharimonas sp.]
MPFKLSRKKIPLYVVVFDQIEIIKKTLDSFAPLADRLDIIVIENPSDNSKEIGKLITSYGNKGVIKRYYKLNENIAGNGFRVVIQNERKVIKSAKYSLITDGDLELDSVAWLDEQLSVMKKHPDLFTCAITLDKSNLPLKNFPESINWVPDDIQEHEDYFQAYTGAHLLMLRSKELLSFMDWLIKNNHSFVDGQLHEFSENILGKKWGRTKQTQAIHLTWSLYHDLDHPYTKFKLAKSFHETWHNIPLDTGFSLTNFS